MEGGVGKGKGGGVAGAKGDPHARPGGVFARDPDERATDVQAGNLMAPALRDLNREKPRSRGNLEHAATERDRLHDRLRDSLESVQVAAGVAVVPVGDEPLHRHAPIWLLLYDRVRRCERRADSSSLRARIGDLLLKSRQNDEQKLSSLMLAHAKPRVKWGFAMSHIVA